MIKVAPKKGAPSSTEKLNFKKDDLVVDKRSLQVVEYKSTPDEGSEQGL